MLGSWGLPHQLLLSALLVLETFLGCGDQALEQSRLCFFESVWIPYCLYFTEGKSPLLTQGETIPSKNCDRY